MTWRVCGEGLECGFPISTGVSGDACDQTGLGNFADLVSFFSLCLNIIFVVVFFLIYHKGNMCSL